MNHQGRRSSARKKNYNAKLAAYKAEPVQAVNLRQSEVEYILLAAQCDYEKQDSEPALRRTARRVIAKMVDAKAAIGRKLKP
jgi:cellobiose-specific phosphotransferase system component IIB